MAEDVAQLQIDLIAKIDKLVTGLNKADRKIKDTSQKAVKHNKKLQGAFRDTAGAIAAIQGPLGPLAGRVNALGASVGRAGVIMTGFGVAMFGATVLAKKAIGAASKYNSEMKTLEGIVLATGHAAGYTAGEIDKMAKSLGEDTLTSASAAREAAGVIATFKSISGDAFKTTLSLAQDMSQAGFGALKQTSLQLAKALEEPVIGLNALRRSGVSFTEQQKKIIKHFAETNQKAKAQAMILDAVNKQVGGAGKKAAEGLAGAMDTLGERVERAWALLGNSAPVELATRAITSLSEAILSFVDPAERAAEAQSKFNDFIQPSYQMLRRLGIAVDEVDPTNLEQVNAVLAEMKKAGIDALANAPYAAMQEEISNAAFYVDLYTKSLWDQEAASKRTGEETRALQEKIASYQKTVDETSAALAEKSTAALAAEQADAKLAAQADAHAEAEKRKKEALKAAAKAAEDAMKQLEKIMEVADPMSAAIESQSNLIHQLQLKLDAGTMSAQAFHEAMVAIGTVGPVTALEEEEQSEADKEREKAAEKLAVLEEKYMSEEELLAVHLGQEAQIIADALAAKAITEEDAEKKRAKMVKRYHDGKKKLDKALYKDTLQAGGQFFGAMMSISKNGNQGLFKIAKAGALATAIADTWLGVAEGVKLGWPAGIPAVAYALATGLGAVSSIQSTSFGGGGGGGGGAAAGGGGAAPAAAAPAAVATPETIVPEANAGGQRVEINLGDEDDLISKRSIRGIIDGINDQIADGAAIQSIAVV